MPSQKYTMQIYSEQHANQQPESSYILPRNIRMLKILHAHPSNHDPNPRHDSGKDNQSRIIPDNRQSGIILELWRSIRRLADIPSPAPDLEAAAHAHHENKPCHDQDNPPPPLGLCVVPGDLLRRFYLGCMRCERRFRPVHGAVCRVWLVECEVGIRA